MRLKNKNILVTAAGQGIGHAAVMAMVAAVLGAPWMLTMPRGQSVQTQFELKPGLQAPIAKGAVIGKVVATANGKPVGETLLVAQSEVDRSGWLLLAWQHVAKLIGM